MDKLDQIITPEQKFTLKYENLDANIAQMAEEIKSLVALHGDTVRGKFAMAVFSQGRVAGRIYGRPPRSAGLPQGRPAKR